MTDAVSGRVRPGDEATLPPEIYGECIAEKGILFSGEVSLVGARNRAGQCVFYPLTRKPSRRGHSAYERGLPADTKPASDTG
ncbi:N5-carboxyaminoimidazole ribonucleotide synthase [Morganella morganii]|nr:N5-carboxyaminoimidazole ribonucleotide synthase [Morganella morganii]